MKEKKARESRVRWSQDEIVMVIDRCAEIQGLEPKWSARRILEEAQAVLPPSRRRPVYPPVVAWMNKMLAQRGQQRKKTQAVSAASVEAPVADYVVRPASPQSASDPTVDSLINYGIRAGSSMLVGILRDPGVQRSIAELITDVLRNSADLTRPQLADHSPVSSATSSTNEILIVGLTEEQAREFGRTYREVLSLQFDKGTAITPGLRAAASRADIVIAIDRTVSSEVARLLHQIVPSYIRHTSGIAGLRQRLADLAMSDDSRITDTGSPGASHGETVPRRRN